MPMNEARLARRIEGRLRTMFGSDEKAPIPSNKISEMARVVAEEVIAEIRNADITVARGIPVATTPAGSSTALEGRGNIS
jgi:hypothetical protein